MIEMNGMAQAHEPRMPAMTGRAAPRGLHGDYDVRIAHSTPVATVTISGRLSADQMVSMLHLLGVDSTTWGQQALLMDLRTLATLYGAENLARIGREIAHSFPQFRKIGLLVQPERVTRISQRAARREGLDMRVFDHQTAAVLWLRDADGLSPARPVN
jgi:hypothetical protein